MPHLNSKLNVLIILILSGWNFTPAQTLDTLIQVENHRLHFHIIKGNDFPILFESGNGDDGSIWDSLLNPIHERTAATLITYDRAGLGKSEIDTSRISFQQEIKDLNNALMQLGYTKDFFLVAHSFGGMYASEFAQLNPGKIKGAVFIDVSTPCNLSQAYTERVKASISEENWKLIRQYKAGLYFVLDQFPEIAAYMSTRYLSASIPMTLIAAENYRPTTQIGETEQDMQKWQACLKTLGNLPNHTYVETKDTDHKVWEKDPKTVIEEIAKLYQEVKRN
ncbi:MAG: alpha/beta hydrolase [Bacteroidota bacterium]